VLETTRRQHFIDPEGATGLGRGLPGIVGTSWNSGTRWSRLAYGAGDAAGQIAASIEPLVR
jgi:hypothetical protein